MNVDQVSILLALLGFFAAALGVVVAGLLVVGRAELLRPLRDLLIPLALAIALISTLGSLYYSGVQEFRPCRLCWWQRISMYPIVPILAVGLIRRDRSAAAYALPLSIMGIGWSLWHNRLHWFPPETETCDPVAPCTALWVNTFGFVTIPFMALCGLVAITALLAASLVLQRHDRSLAEPELESSLV